MKLIVPGNPIPKARPRVVHGHAYTDKDTERAEIHIRMRAKIAKWQPLQGPVRLQCLFYRSNARACDLDNLAKLVQDALNGIAYRDDSQVVQLLCEKTMDRCDPRTVIVVEPARGVMVEAATLDGPEGWNPVTAGKDEEAPA